MQEMIDKQREHILALMKAELITERKREREKRQKKLKFLLTKLMESDGDNTEPDTPPKKKSKKSTPQPPPSCEYHKNAGETCAGMNKCPQRFRKLPEKSTEEIRAESL